MRSGLGSTSVSLESINPEWLEVYMRLTDAERSVVDSVCCDMAWCFIGGVIGKCHFNDVIKSVDLGIQIRNGWGVSVVQFAWISQKCVVITEEVLDELFSGVDVFLVSQLGDYEGTINKQDTVDSGFLRFLSECVARKRKVCIVHAVGSDVSGVLQKGISRFAFNRFVLEEVSVDDSDDIARFWGDL